MPTWTTMQATPTVRCCRWVWRTDLAASAPFWPGWYQGLSEAFLGVRVPKLLVLANTNRLDTSLTIAQMQGKFQMFLVPQASCIHRRTMQHLSHESGVLWCVEVPHGRREEGSVELRVGLATGCCVTGSAGRWCMSHDLPALSEAQPACIGLHAALLFVPQEHSSGHEIATCAMPSTCCSPALQLGWARTELQGRGAGWACCA